MSQVGQLWKQNIITMSTSKTGTTDVARQTGNITTTTTTTIIIIIIMSTSKTSPL
jgi:hypothetical protein